MNDLEINNLAERIAKGKPLNVLIRILTFVSALAGMMSMFLPFGKIMYYHPESFSIISLTKYNVNNLVLLMSIVIGICANLIMIMVEPMLNKKQTKKIVCLNIIGAIVCFFALICCVICAASSLYDVELFCDMRVDESIAYYTMYVCVFIPLVLNMTSAVIISLIKSGKVTVEKMFGK